MLEPPTNFTRRGVLRSLSSLGTMFTTVSGASVFGGTRSKEPDTASRSRSALSESGPSSKKVISLVPGDDLQARIDELGEDGVVRMAPGTYDAPSGIIARHALSIEPLGAVRLRLTGVQSYVLRHESALTVRGSGSLLIDGNGYSERVGINSASTLPELYFVTVKNCDAGFATGTDPVDEFAEHATGHGTYYQCEALDCADIGFSLRAALPGSTVSLTECRTSGSTGSGKFARSGAGYLFNIRGFDRVVFRGGDFTGHPEARCTNAIRCDSAEIIGGYYHDISRGPTIGNSTTDFVISGVVCKRISNVAISCDVTRRWNGTIGRGVVSANHVFDSRRAFRSTGGSILVTSNSAVDCGDDSDGVYAFSGRAVNVHVVANSCTTSELSKDYTAFSVANGTFVDFRNNFTDSTSVHAYTASKGASAAFANVRVASDPVVLAASDDIVEIAPASDGSDLASLLLPTGLQSWVTGKIIKVVFQSPVIHLQVACSHPTGSVNGKRDLEVTSLSIVDVISFVSLSGGRWLMSRGS